VGIHIIVVAVGATTGQWKIIIAVFVQAHLIPDGAERIFAIAVLVDVVTADFSGTRIDRLTFQITSNVWVFRCILRIAFTKAADAVKVSQTPDHSWVNRLIVHAVNYPDLFTIATTKFYLQSVTGITIKKRPAGIQGL
jgi:hypothetical protein